MSPADRKLSHPGTDRSYLPGKRSVSGQDKRAGFPSSVLLMPRDYSGDFGKIIRLSGSRRGELNSVYYDMPSPLKSFKF